MPAMQLRTLDYEICQQMLYYQVLFDIGWLIFWICWLFRKYWVGLTFSDPDVGRLALMCLWLISEPIRMSAGWYGNLQENVPWLILFAILSFIPLQAVIFYMMLGAQGIEPFSKSVQFVQAIMAAIELLYSIFVIFRMYRMQKQQFYQFEYVLNQRRRNAAYNVDPQQRNIFPGGGGGGGIGSHGSRRQTRQSVA